jgi:hypothetical protein
MATNNHISGSVGSAVQAGNIGGGLSFGRDEVVVNGEPVRPSITVAEMVDHARTRIADLEPKLPYSQAAIDELQGLLKIAGEANR